MKLASTECVIRRAGLSPLDGVGRFQLGMVGAIRGEGRKELGGREDIRIRLQRWVCEVEKGV